MMMMMMTVARRVTLSVFALIALPRFITCHGTLTDNVQKEEGQRLLQERSSVPSPAPTIPQLFAGVDYDLPHCARDIAISDTDRDGFISREEYLILINQIGTLFCFEQSGTLDATQVNSFFVSVCELEPNCRLSSEIPIRDLTADQLIAICTNARSTIFTECANGNAPSSSPTPPTIPPSVRAVIVAALLRITRYPSTIAKSHLYLRWNSCRPWTVLQCRLQ